MKHNVTKISILLALFIVVYCNQQEEEQDLIPNEDEPQQEFFFFPRFGKQPKRAKRLASELVEDAIKEFSDEDQKYIKSFSNNGSKVHRRSKRQLMELISGLTSGGGDGSSLSNLIPGFSEYGPAFMSLINNFLGFMKCCGPVNIPEVIAKVLMKCSDDLTTKFFADSGFLNRTEVDKKTTIFLKSPSLSGFFEAGFCSVKCVYGRMKLLTKEGLPNPPEMKKVLQKVMNSTMNLLGPAFDECEKSYNSEYALVKASAKPLTDSDRCWGSAGFVECMYRQIIQVCPEETIQAGSLCLQKMGNFFWAEMPKQVGKFFSVVKSMVDIL